MVKDIFYTAIDLGTSKVCTITAWVGPEGELKIVGMGLVPSQGIQKGRIVNVAETHEAMQASLEEAQRHLGKNIPWAYVSVTGNHISCLNSTGFLSPSPHEGPISVDDVQELVQSSYPKVDTDKEVLHIIPINYVIDGLREVRSLEGLHANRVQVESHVVLGETSALRNVVRTVEDCGVSVKRLVLAPLASSEVTLTENEKEMGVVLVDIGGGTTDIAIFRNGSLWYNSSIPVGGNQLTRDLAVALGLPYYFAEELKVRWGHASPNGIESQGEVLLPSFQGRPRRLIRQDTLCRPLVDRLQEILGLVVVKTQQAGLQRLPPCGVVITGGSAETPGLQEMTKKVLACPARVAAPLGITGLSPELEKPNFSTALGLLRWGIKHHSEKQTHRNDEKSLWPHRTLRRLKRVVEAR